MYACIRFCITAGGTGEYELTTRFYHSVRSESRMHFSKICPGLYVGSCPRQLLHIRLLKEELKVTCIFNLQTEQDIWSRNLETFLCLLAMNIRVQLSYLCDCSSNYPDPMATARSAEDVSHLCDSQGLRYVWLPTTDMCDSARKTACANAAFLLLGLIKGVEALLVEDDGEEEAGDRSSASRPSSRTSSKASSEDESAATPPLGGGAIYVPVLILVMDFTPYEAVATSQALIFGGSLAGTILNFFRRNPRRPDRPVIDVEMVALMGPMQIAGATVGVVVNRCLPTYLVLGLLVLLLLFMSYKTLLQALRLKRESKEVALEAPLGGADSLIMLQDGDEELAAKREKHKTQGDETPKDEAEDEGEGEEGKEEEVEEEQGSREGVEEEQEVREDERKQLQLWSKTQQEASNGQQQEKDTEEGTEHEGAEDEDGEGKQQQQQQLVAVMLDGKHKKDHLRPTKNPQQRRTQGGLWNRALSGGEMKQQTKQHQKWGDGGKQHSVKRQELPRFEEAAKRQQQQQAVHHLELEKHRERTTSHAGDAPVQQRCTSAPGTSTTAGGAGLAGTCSAAVAAATEEGRAITKGGSTVVGEGLDAPHRSSSRGTNYTRDNSSGWHSTNRCFCGVSAHESEVGADWQKEKRRHTCGLLAVSDSVTTTGETEKERNEEKLFTKDAVAAAAPAAKTAGGGAAASVNDDAAATPAKWTGTETLVPEPKRPSTGLTVSAAARGDDREERQVDEENGEGPAAADAATESAAVVKTDGAKEQEDSEKALPINVRSTWSSTGAPCRDKDGRCGGEEERETSGTSLPLS
ncbi:UNVERIFIED_CONTAM: hypothetical protein H355_012072 [Colinus virginianus]|nr:hypothetical protein H355_012072 [Colinus virginianus]